MPHPASNASVDTNSQEEAKSGTRSGETPKRRSSVDPEETLTITGHNGAQREESPLRPVDLIEIALEITRAKVYERDCLDNG